MKELFILRGLPGSGKSELAELLVQKSSICCADDYFVNEIGQYIFIKEKIGDAHRFCKEKCKYLMEHCEPRIVVANTSTTESEIQPYMDLAKIHGYKIFSLVVENRHGNTNVHNVPDETLVKMKERFQIKL